MDANTAGNVQNPGVDDYRTQWSEANVYITFIIHLSTTHGCQNFERTQTRALLTAKDQPQPFSLTRHTHSSKHLIWIWLFKTAQILDPSFAQLIFIFNMTWSISMFQMIHTHMFSSPQNDLITHILFKNSWECSWNSIWLRKSSITPNFLLTG